MNSDLESEEIQFLVPVEPEWKQEIDRNRNVENILGKSGFWFHFMESRDQLIRPNLYTDIDKSVQVLLISVS